MSIAFLLNPGYNTINNVHHTFWNQDEDNIKNESLNPVLAVATSLSAPSHIVTGGTNPAQLFMSDPITLETDAPQFKAPILQAPSAELEEITELTPAAGITFLNDAHFTSGTGVDEVVRDIDGVGTLTCDTLKYTTLDPAIPTADVSQWATFGASANVNLNGKNLTDSTRSSVFIPQNITSLTTTGLGETMIGNSVDDTTKSAVLALQTNYLKSGDATARFTQNPNNAVVTGTYFYNKPRSLNVSSDGSVILRSAVSEILMVYGNGDKAFLIGPSGQLSFNATISNGGMLNGNAGTAGQIVQSNGISAPPSWVNAPSASNWSTFDATSDVDLAGFRLTNSSTTDEKIVYATSSTADPFAAMMVTKTASSATADDITFIGSEIYPTSGISTSFNIVTKNSGAIKKTDKYGDLPGSATFVSFNASANILSNDAGNSTIITYDTSRKGIEFNNYGCVAFDSVCNSGATPPTPGSFGTSGQILQSNGSTVAPSWVSPAISGRYVLYVATNGLDANAGDITNPKLTIQSAINTATALYPQQVAIVIAPGVYSGALSITTPNITLLGYAPSANQNLLTQIVGNISIACTASQDLYYSQIGIFNLQVSGSITDTSSAVHSLNIEQCRLASNGRIVWQNSSVDNRTRLERVVLLHAAAGAGTDPLLCFSSGMATLNLLDVTAKDNAPVLQFDGTATLNTCTLCTFSSTTTSPTAAPIVYIAIANGGTAPLSQKGFAFAYCAFTYSAPVARAFSSGKNCGIVTDSITGNVNLIITYNAFNLLLCDATCFVVSDINKNTPSKASTVRFFSNLSTYLATGIDTLSGNKTTFAAVA
jgi:hypothetical protein